jgi:hypothetical protein
MLETIAIAALVLGGVSSATLMSDDDAVAKEDSKTVAVEVQKADNQQAEAAKNPFLD